MKRLATKPCIVPQKWCATTVVESQKLGHNLRVATFDHHDARVYFCLRCYRYSTFRLQGLAEPCKGKKAIQEAVRQRLQAGLHPTREWTVRQVSVIAETAVIEASSLAQHTRGVRCGFGNSIGGAEPPVTASQ